jgi:hypothetical protein
MYRRRAPRPGPPKAVGAATTDRSAEEFRGRESGSSVRVGRPETGGGDCAAQFGPIPCLGRDGNSRPCARRVATAVSHDRGRGAACQRPAILKRPVS